MPIEMSPEEREAYEGWCDAVPERGLDDGGVQKRSFSGGFHAGLAYQRKYDAKAELLLALYDHLSAEIGELHDKIDRLIEAIEETRK